MSSRGRPELLKQSIKSAYGLSKYKDRNEYLLRVDDDDIDTIDLLRSDNYFKQIKNLRIFIDKRVGYEYLWYIYKKFFSISKGVILFVICDDLHIILKDWDEKFYTYKDKEFVMSYRARLILTKKVIDKYEYIRDWTSKTIRADENIWRYALKNNFHIHIENWFRKNNPIDIIKNEGVFGGWRLKDKTVVDNLTWEETNVGQIST